MIVRAAFTVCVILFGTFARAEPLPAFFDVSGVAQTDVLNVRAAPNTSASILDRLASDVEGIEVVARDESGDWGRINMRERSGWVAMRYLARQPGQPGDVLPRPLNCSGTEPFWSLSLISDQKAEFSRSGQDPVSFGNLYTVVAENRTDRYAIFGESEARVLTSVFRRDLCTDGMSDRAYGIDVDIFLTEQSGVSFVSGCCTISR